MPRLFNQLLDVGNLEQEDGPLSCSFLEARMDRKEVLGILSDLDGRTLDLSSAINLALSPFARTRPCQPPYRHLTTAFPGL